MSGDVLTDDRSNSPSSVEETKPNCQNIVLKNFIETFEELPELWDVTHIEYKNKDSRNEALGRLLAIQRQWNPDATRDDVRKKINSLRSNFRKELKKIEAMRRSGKKYTPNSWTFKALLFLCKGEHRKDNFKPSMKVKKTETTESTSAGTNYFSYFVNPDDIQHTKTLKEEKCAAEKKVEVLEKACELLSQSQKQDQTPTVEPLAIVWSQKLQSLDPMQRTLAEKAINDILFEAQFNNLHRESVKINVQDSSQ